MGYWPVTPCGCLDHCVTAGLPDVNMPCRAVPDQAVTGKTRAGLSVPLAMTWACAPVRVGPSSGASGRVVGGLAAGHMGAHVGPEAGSDILLSLQSAESQEPPEEARAHVS